MAKAAKKKAAPKKVAAKKAPAKKVAPKKAAPKKVGPIEGYSIGQKKKVPLSNVVISQKKNGGFIAKGQDAKGTNIATMMDAVRAQAAVESGQATFAKGAAPKK